MSWEITQDDMQRFTQHQHHIKLYALSLHLLTLPEPPTAWETCQARLTEQLTQADKLNIHSLPSLRLFVEALHIAPNALTLTAPLTMLRSSGSEEFRCQRLLAWANTAHEQALSTENINPHQGMNQ